MSEIIDNILNSIKPNSSFNWVVEAVVPSSDYTDAFYSTLGFFKTEKEAESYVIKMTETFKYEFVHFRYAKIGSFRNFINKSNTIILTTDKDFNKKILQHNKEKEAFIQSNKLKQDFLSEYNSNK